MDGKSLKMPRIAVVVLQQLRKASQGESKAAGEVLRLAERLGFLVAGDEHDDQQGLSRADAEIIKDFARRLGEKPTGKDET